MDDGEEVAVTTNVMREEELRGIFEGIKKILKNYIDTKEENYSIIALWILGTWIHDCFPTYPYLFINAMKGSGKTRLLKLIKELSWQGDMLASLSEAVLFRTTGTLCIDEFEGVGGKDKNALRELLNTAYKKGGKVKRMKKKKTIFGEEQVVEEFSTFRPIVMANIWGMEEVLGDRCISIILEKSCNGIITRKIEDFEGDKNVQEIKEKLLKIANLVSLCRVVSQKNIYQEWNTYINNTTTHTTLTTLNDINDTTLYLFDKIWNTEIDGRNLELSLPLLLISEEIGIFDGFIDVMKDLVENKKEDDNYESKDVMVFNLISGLIPGIFYKMKDLTAMFKQSINYDEEEERWLNIKWLGKALKRLNLILEKKRMNDGREVVLDTKKAAEKLKLFSS